MNADTTQDTVVERSHNILVLLYLGSRQTPQSSTVFFRDDDIVRYIDQTACQITRIGCFEGRIGKTFTGTVRRDEVLQHGQTFLEVGKNRVLDGLSTFSTRLLRFSHKTTHTG